ncbi:MAG: hypothetical protein RIA71_00840 [Oceanicaulis sp.]
MFRFALATAIGLLLTGCATSDGSDSAASSRSSTQIAMNANGPAGEMDPDEEICRRVEQTGSRFHARMCKTRAEWERDTVAARDATDAMQNGSEPAQCAYSGSC